MILQKSVVMELLTAAALAAVCCVLVRSAAAAWTGRRQVFLLQQNRLQRKRRKGRSLWLWLLPLFICAGALRAQYVRGQCEKEILMDLGDKTVEICGKVSEASEKGEWVVLTLENGAVRTVTGGEPNGMLDRILVYVEAADVEESSYPCIGSQVRVRGECSEFEPSHNPGEFDYRMYYRSLKLNYRMFAFTFELMDGDFGGLWDRYRDGLRRFSLWASKRLEILVGEEDAGVFRAVLLGDKSGLSENIRGMYQKNGIAHLLAVSGLHLSLVSMAAYGLCRRLGARYGTAGIAGGFVLLSFALMTGASPSVVRALIMALCGFLAAYLGRTYDLMSALALSALWLLWDSPYLLFQAGVQLSFGAVTGIGWLAVCLQKICRSGMRTEQAFLLSVSMQLATLPLILFHFFQYPLYGIFLNLLVVPLMGIVLASGAAGIALGTLSLSAGRFAAGSGCMVLGWYEWCCSIFERFPGSSVVLGRPELWQIGAYYGILASAVWMAGRSSAVCGGEAGNRVKCGAEMGIGDGGGSGESAGSAESGCEAGGRAATGAFCVVVLLVVVLLPLPVRGLEVTFLDVSQGDGICLRTGWSPKTLGDGQALPGLAGMRPAVIMVDGGSTDEKNLGQARLEPFLKSRGIRTVDYWMVSHGDQDHISGLVWMLEESGDIAVRNLVLPAAGYGDKAYDRLAALAERRGAAVSWMEQDDSFSLGQLKVTCIYPEETKEAPLPGSVDRNEHSLVLRTDYGGFHMLLTGDMSGDGEKRLMQKLKAGTVGDIQVLKVAHHGSRFSSTEEWLAEIRPVWAVVSYGEDNRYGHPHRETMERFEEQDITVLKTAESGAVILRTDGEEIAWQTWITKR